MHFSSGQLGGIVPPLLTPLRSDETLDEENYARLIRHVLDGGVHGLFPMGSAGEGTNVDRAVWEQANRVSLREADGRVPVYCGAIEPSTARAVESIKRLEQLGATYVVATPIFYMDTSCQRELIRHFETLCSRTSAQIVVYNIPALTQVNVLPETMQELSRIDRIVGYKDTCGNWDQHYRTLRLLENEDIRVFSGGEELSGTSLLFGAHGNIAGLANLFPALFVKLYEAARSGDIETVKTLQDSINRIKRMCRAGSSWLTGMKYVMHRMGFGLPHPSVPIEPLAQDEMIALDGLLEQIVAESRNAEKEASA